MRDAKKAYTQSNSAGGSTDATPRHILKLSHKGAAPDWGRSLDNSDCLLNVVSGQLQAGCGHLVVAGCGRRGAAVRR